MKVFFERHIIQSCVPYYIFLEPDSVSFNLRAESRSLRNKDYFLFSFFGAEALNYIIYLAYMEKVFYINNSSYTYNLRLENNYLFLNLYCCLKKIYHKTFRVS